MPQHYQSFSRIMVEIDLPKCTRTYGVAPCTASIPATGSDKCFNCIRTCQDRTNYEETTLTLRLADEAPDDYYTVADSPVPVITNINSISITPAIVRPGVDAGERETLTVSCKEHPDSDTQLDPYVTERSYNPYLQGTFWQRLRARYVTFEGFPLRLYRGFAGQDRDLMDVYHYSITAVSSDGKSATITAKDPFTLADSKKAQAPVLSNGRLLTGIDADDISITLTPTGIGDSEYPASGKVCLSGKEVCAFTRAGDVMTIARPFTGAQAHSADAAVQLCLVYAGISGAVIIHDLLVNYAVGIDPAWIDLAAWQSEIDNYYGTLLSATIAAPFSVAKLINEVIAQLPGVFWWDSREQQFRLQALRPADPAAPLLDSNSFIDQSFKVSEQPDARADTIWTYFGQIDPTASLDETNNFATTLATVDANSAVDYNTNAIKTINSRWIPATARGTAQILNATLLGRYRDPPRKIDFGVWRNIVRRPGLGDIYRVTHPFIQDAFGAPAVIPVQLCTVKADDSSYLCSAQEVIYVQQGGDAETGVRFLYIDHDITDVNLRALYDSVFVTLTGITEVHLVIGTDATIGASSVYGYALSIRDEDWPSDVDLFIDMNDGLILGKGGDGLDRTGGTDTTGNPEAGTPATAGPALLTTRPVTFTGSGIIGGGGGASARWAYATGGPVHRYAAWGGAGGAGYRQGVQGTAAAWGAVNTAAFYAQVVPAAKLTGGYNGCQAGDLGVDGSNVYTGVDPDPGPGSVTRIGNAGLAGHAIDGVANITFIGSDIDIRGATT